MRIRALLLASALGFASTFLPGLSAQAQAPAALTGTVTSQQEGKMEGVLVSAKKAGGTVTITVVSDADGKFSFPASRLEPGDYTISIRAIGYDLDGPQQVKIGSSPASTDIKLVKTKNLARQMSNGEWIASIPGSQQQKLSLLNCVSCHSVDRIVKSSYDKEAFATQILPRMASYANQSTPIHI